MEEQKIVGQTSLGSNLNPVVNPEYQAYLRLCQEVHAHSYRYYTLDNPSVSDAVYDQLYNEILRIEREKPLWVFPGSPTQRVGAEPLKYLNKYTRASRMYSLENSYSKDDVQAFCSRVLEQYANTSFVTEPKLDGASIELVYHIDSQLKLALLYGSNTRGRYHR